jgi:hypothetical protein
MYFFEIMEVFPKHPVSFGKAYIKPYFPLPPCVIIMYHGSK